MRKIKIVCIIGLVLELEEMIEKLINVGMNVVWLNFLYGSYEEYKGRIDIICKVVKRLDKIVVILLDMKGLEICMYNMKDGIIEFECGNEVIVSMNEVEGMFEKFLVIYENLINDV